MPIHSKFRVSSNERRNLHAATRALPVSSASPTFIIFHEEFDRILGETPTLHLALTSQEPLFHEAGVYIPSQDALFVTSNQFVPSNSTQKLIHISELTREDGKRWVQTLVDADIVMANGGVNYKDAVLFCEQGDLTHAGGLTIMSPHPPYTTKRLVNSYFGRSFNSPNDVVVHLDGSIWFTDPIYGYEQGIRPKPELPNQVYRFEPDTGDVRVVADELGRPNGICFSPDFQTLYLTDTDWIHGDGSTDDTRASTIYAYDIITRHNSPFLTNRRVFAMADTGVPDGIKCDTDGNVYSGTGDGLSVWNAGGVLLGKVLVQGGIANFCFGRPGEIFLLNEDKFWVLEVGEHVRGALLEGMGISVDEVAATT